jgi:hypothetical protein
MGQAARTETCAVPLRSPAIGPRHPTSLVLLLLPSLHAGPLYTLPIVCSEVDAPVPPAARSPPSFPSLFHLQSSQQAAQQDLRQPMART